MKKTILIASILFSINAIAQSENETGKSKDTIRVGNMVIVGGGSENNNYKSKNNSVVIYSMNDTLVAVKEDTVKVGRINIINKRGGDYSNNTVSILGGDFKKTKISIEKAPKHYLKNVTTNWWIFDLGFANFNDLTSNGTNPFREVQSLSATPVIPNSNYLRLNNTKSSNVNIWIVQQKMNLYKHIWNLKYGVGIEMFNFRFENPISFRNGASDNIYIDNVNFSKNKLFVNYLTVPIQLNFHSNPYDNKSFYASIGFSTGYLIQSHTKQISNERGKQKVYGTFNLSNLRMATIGELGIGSIRLYGSLGLTNLFDKQYTYLNVQPYAVGIRFSKF